MTSSKRTGKNTALAVLKAVTKFISTINEDDAEALASGTASLTLARAKKSSGQAELEMDDPKTGTRNYDHLRDDLSAATSTDAGAAILHDAQLSRSELERLARLLDLPVMKQDSVGRLEEKVIEALIGSRLNSRAVRGR
jgi:hypothetical protein